MKENEEVYDSYAYRRRADQVEFERKSSFNKGDTVEKLAALGLGLAFAAFLAYFVVTGVKHSLDKISHTIETAGQIR
jgi:hypothetical protein